MVLDERSAIMKADKGRGHTLPFPFSISAPLSRPGISVFRLVKH
ncbi:hypothetical protein CHCC14809_1444 [Bacillus licheniformis]|uniref:Uncharacterized protein n=1 Tax=Bacillus licheniformis TaxID=1402 RepID=A0A8B5YJ71_BACLI|nr:hypothetical protein MUY_003799 [Bacillus licheniformis WX-02]KYC73224.1 hypothetical protein B4092_3950 [Bacillus licheniformis]TWN10838.1 hypothetical protein CHCC14564_3390 [Bacillus licheniformis LMG 17339]KYC84663.1 hypothetical protein B4091_3993 [Bacillus licheniformis]KYD00217.1 hypothetical protein B4164_3737 [Bacillus licheniformis]